MAALVLLMSVCLNAMTYIEVVQQRGKLVTIRHSKFGLWQHLENPWLIAILAGWPMILTWSTNPRKTAQVTMKVSPMSRGTVSTVSVLLLLFSTMNGPLRGA